MDKTTADHGVMYLDFPATSSRICDLGLSDARGAAGSLDGRRRGVGRHSGGQTFAMRLWLDPVRMAGRGVSPSDVSAAIAANNFQPPLVRPRLLHRLEHPDQYGLRTSISSRR